MENAGFSHRQRPQGFWSGGEPDAGAVVVVDEAGQIRGRQMLALKADIPNECHPAGTGQNLRSIVKQVIWSDLTSAASISLDAVHSIAR